MKQLTLIAAALLVITGCADEETDTESTMVPVIPRDVPELQLPRPDKVDLGQEDEAPKPPPISEQGPYPKVEVAETTFQFGLMQVGTTMQHEFTISNEGEATMHLVAGKSTCKCTKFELDKDQIAPGETATLTVEWIGKARDPRFQHGGPVFTDDPERPEVNFVVRGEVDAPFELLPEGTWTVENLTDEEPGKAMGIVCSRLYSDFEITEIVHDSEYITPEAIPLTKSELSEVAAKCGYKIVINVSPDVPPGKFSDNVELKVNRGDNLSMRIGVAATREGPIKVVTSSGGIWVGSKTSLRMGTFDKDEGHESVMVLVTRADSIEGELEILEVETRPHFLEVELEPFPARSEVARRYKLHVRIPPGIAKTRMGSSNPAIIKLRTNHPKSENFNFEVTFNAF
ncbi:MAG: DUF1573 domain-containing protein [Planctomycetaceae bacterium]|nr:DUF1573 domain-containing protein [Planctomycetaceae bacterium]